MSDSCNELICILINLLIVINIIIINLYNRILCAIIVNFPSLPVYVTVFTPTATMGLAVKLWNGILYSIDPNICLLSLERHDASF